METLAFEYPFPVTLTEELQESKIFSFIGFYGDSANLALALFDYFGNRLRIRPGFCICLNKALKKAALVYCLGDEIIAESKRPDKTFIAYLLSICEEIVACFSGSIIKKWYFEDRAKFRGHFKKGFELINSKTENSLEMKLECKNCINSKLFNLNDMQISSNFAYGVIESLKIPDRLALVQHLSSNFVQELFKFHSNPHKVKSKFIKFLDKIDDLIYCNPETTKDLFESIKHLFMKLNSSVPAIYLKMCESIKNELFHNNENLDKTAEIINFSLIDYFFDLILKNPTKKTQKIAELYNETVVSKLPPGERKLALRIFDSHFYRACQEISLIEEDIVAQAIEKLAILEKFWVVQTLEIPEYLVEKMNKVEEKDVLRKFVLSFSNRVGGLRSLDRLVGGSLVCLLVNEEEKGTNLFLVLHDGRYLHHFLEKTDYVIVKGCDEEWLVVLDSSGLTAYFFAVEKDGLVEKGGKRFEGCVRFPCYLRKSKEIVFIDGEDKPVLCGLALDDQPRYYDLSPFAINTRYTDERFEYIFLSDDNKILGLVLKSSLMLIHRDYDLMVKTPLEKPNFTSAFIYHTDETYFLVILYKSRNLHYKLAFPRSSHPHCFQNPILDILEDASRLILHKPAIKCKSLSVFIEPGYSLPEPSLISYYSLLTSINSSILLKPSFNPNSSTSSTSSSSLSLTLFQYSSFKLVQIFPFGLNSSLNDSSSQETDPIVIRLKNMQNFEFFESQMKGIESVCVVSIIARRWEEIDKVLQNVFNIFTFEQDNNEIFIRFARVTNKDFALMTWVLGHSKLDLNALKAYEVVTGLADRVILAARFSSMDHVPRVANEVCFAKGRIGGDGLFCYDFDLVVLDSEDNGASKIQDCIKILPMQTSICLFSASSSPSFLAELLLYKFKITEKPARLSGSQLIDYTKLVISQVVTGDNHSLDYWTISSSTPSIPAQTPEAPLCQEQAGICDHKIVKSLAGFSTVPCKLAKGHPSPHYCNEKCFNCGAYCQLEYGHFGYHSTKQHFNCDINFFTNKKVAVGGSLASLSTMHYSWNEKLWKSPLQSLND